MSAPCSIVYRMPFPKVLVCATEDEVLMYVADLVWKLYCIACCIYVFLARMLYIVSGIHSTVRSDGVSNAQHEIKSRKPLFTLVLHLL